MQALILAGGSGTRFWPLSRRSSPKQLLALDGERTLLQATADRLAPLVAVESIWVCTTRSIADQVAGQLPAVPAAQILAEPEGRDTSAAIGWSLRRIRAAAGDDLVVVLPADHRMGLDDVFRRALERARRVAADGRVVALGVVPRWPEPGYGYLELGERLDEAIGLREVRRFTEKPDPETAARFFDSGDYHWNAGIFVFRASVLLAELARLQPELWDGLERIDRASDPAERDRLYGRLPRISIDFGVMEKLNDLVTVALDCEWSDLGGWAALAEILPTDAAGNAIRGDVLAFDASDNLLYADQGTVAAVGVRGLVVVRTGDAVLVVPRRRAQEIRKITEELERRGSDELL